MGAYNPRDMDWLRDSSGRSSSEPGGICANFYHWSSKVV